MLLCYEVFPIDKTVGWIVITWVESRAHFHKAILVLKHSFCAQTSILVADLIHAKWANSQL